MVGGLHLYKNVNSPKIGFEILLSQLVTSSSYESNESTYSHVHTIKKNKVASKYAVGLVYVLSNLCLLSRKNKEYR